MGYLVFEATHDSPTNPENDKSFHILNCTGASVRYRSYRIQESGQYEHFININTKNSFGGNTTITVKTKKDIQTDIDKLIKLIFKAIRKKRFIYNLTDFSFELKREVKVSTELELQ